MKKLVSMLLAAVMCAALLAGCGGTAPASTPASTPESTTPASTPDTGKPAKIGVAMATTQSTFYAKMAKIIEDYCKEQGIDCTISDPNYDLAKQIEEVENFIASGCTAIVVVAFDPEGINDVCKQAVDQGIYVVCYDGEIEAAQGSLVVKQYDYGYAIGSNAAAWITSNEEMMAQDKIEVGIFDYPTIPAIIDRANGIIDALKESCPNVEIVEQQSASLTDEGVTLGENFLQAHPNMQVICGINDNAVLGAYQVWSAAGHVGDNIGFFGADADEGALELISQGTSYRGSVALTAETSFPELIDTCVKASKGEEVPETLYLGMTQITPENVADFMG